MFKFIAVPIFIAASLISSAAESRPYHNDHYDRDRHFRPYYHQSYYDRGRYNRRDYYRHRDYGYRNGAVIFTFGNIFGGRPVDRRFTDRDIVYINQTAYNSFETVPTYTTTSWSNPDTGNYGTITPTRTYEQQGRYCREYQQNVTVGGRVQESYGTACRQPDGQWEII